MGLVFCYVSLRVKWRSRGLNRLFVNCGRSRLGLDLKSVFISCESLLHGYPFHPLPRHQTRDNLLDPSHLPEIVKVKNSASVKQPLMKCHNLATYAVSSVNRYAPLSYLAQVKRQRRVPCIGSSQSTIVFLRSIDWMEMILGTRGCLFL